MKKYFFVLSVLLLGACTHSSKDGKVETAVSQESEEEVCAEQGQETAEPEVLAWQCDGALAYKELPFTGSEDSIPCLYDSRNALFLVGFGMDEEAAYFVGGEPLQVAAYSHDKLKYRRTLEGFSSDRDLCRFTRDSIYIVDEIHKKLIRVSKSGEGDVAEYDLDAEIDTVYGGAIYEDHLMLYNHTKELDDGEGLSRWYYRLLSFDYQGHCFKEDTVATFECGQEEYPSPEGCVCEDDNLLYKGMYGGRYVFWGLTNKGDGSGAGVWRLAILSNEGKMMCNFDLPYDDYVCAALGMGHGAAVWFWKPSPNFSFLRGKYFYTLHYFGDRKMIRITRFDLSKAFPEI